VRGAIPEILDDDDAPTAGAGPLRRIDDAESPGIVGGSLPSSYGSLFTNGAPSWAGFVPKTIPRSIEGSSMHDVFRLVSTDR
jgi:hypothetical protein